ncbi:MAG TPA: fibronectin type III domain-containing protein [Clostridia bacterium]|nr:fibronectin type III domain-containing protein [Clostridia bacterium]
MIFKSNVGPASNEVSAIFRAITLEAKTSEDGICLKWNKPWDSKNITGYNLYRGTASGKQSGTPITDFPIDGTSHTDKNIKPNTIYYYILKPVYKDKTLGNATNEAFAKSGSKTITILLEVGNRYMYVNGERREIDPGMETNQA